MKSIDSESLSFKEEIAKTNTLGGLSRPKFEASSFKWLIQIVFLLCLGIAWQWIAELQVFEKSLFPSPEGILESFDHWYRNGGLQAAIRISLRRVVTGYAFCVIAGVFLGMLIGRLEIFEWTLGTLIRVLQSIPGIAWVPLAIVWFQSVSETAKIFIIVTGGLFPIVISTSAGVKTVPPVYIKSALTLGARGPSLFYRVILPAAIPAIVAGMRVSWAFSWRALAAAEIVLAVRTGPGQEGLGGLIDVSRQFSDINTAGMVMVILAAIGLVVDGAIFYNLEKRIRKVRGLT